MLSLLDELTQLYHAHNLAALLSQTKTERDEDEDALPYIVCSEGGESRSMV
ncbi:MAG: hypothetical protein MUQ10_10165 [Anaerolineae bacterium]|nr:hypothetical protein [Anaerolineae bacterium]